MQQQASTPAALTKINLVSLHKAAFQDGYQAGKYHQLYREQIKDIASEQTTRLPAIQPATRTVRNTNKYDLRVIALPRAMDDLIKGFKRLYGKFPDEIRLHPETIDLLRQASFILGNRYRGIVTITEDGELDKLNIYIDQYTIVL